MPFSSGIYLPEVNKILSKIKVERFLDIGAGNGKYGALVQQTHPNSHRIGLEIEEAYIQTYGLQHYYQELWCMSVEDLISAKPNEDYDLIIFGDTIEHLRKSVGIDLLNFLIYHTKYLLVLFPEQLLQGAWEGHQQEAHISVWTNNDFSAFDHVFLHRARKDFAAINGYLLDRSKEPQVQDILVPTSSLDKISQTNFLPPNYHAREPVKANISPNSADIASPEAYLLAAHLARQHQATHIISIGCGKLAQQLSLFHPEFSVIGVDSIDLIDGCRFHYEFGEWIEWDFEKPGLLPLPYETLQNSIVICANFIERLRTPNHLLYNLRHILNDAPLVILTTPDRERLYTETHFGPPASPLHVREWGLNELRKLLHARNFNVEFLGHTIDSNVSRKKRTSLAILANNNQPQIQPAPDHFKVVAIVPTHNEQDVLPHCLNDLIAQGIEVYIIDDWSTDSTYEIAQSYIGKGVIGVERFPNEGPSHNILRRRMQRVQDVSRTLNADWVILHDSDEIRESPWAGVRVKDAIYYLDQTGFNCLDYTVLNFEPTDNEFQAGSDFGSYFRYFNFGTHPAYFMMHKGWKDFGQPLTLQDSGSHTAFNDGKRVAPYKFLLRHYPIRSQEHGLRKVLGERLARYDTKERMQGMNNHYDHVDEHHQFIKTPDSLIRFDNTFYSNYLVERLSGIGIRENITEEWLQKIYALQAQQAAKEQVMILADLQARQTTEESIAIMETVAITAPPIDASPTQSAVYKEVIPESSLRGSLRTAYHTIIPLSMRLKIRNLRGRMIRH